MTMNLVTLQRALDLLAWLAPSFAPDVAPVRVVDVIQSYQTQCQRPPDRRDLLAFHASAQAEANATRLINLSFSAKKSELHMKAVLVLQHFMHSCREGRRSGALSRDWNYSSSS